MLHSLHHINWLVGDMDIAVSKFKRFFGHEPTREYLAGREVDTARFELSGGYFVLVSPRRADSVVGKILAKHGEGLFLLSLQQDETLNADQKALLSESGPRRGILDWVIWDVDGLNNERSTLQLTLNGHELSSEAQ